MPIVPSFSVSQGADASSITIVDTSTGSDGTITDRKINLYDSANVLFGASPYDFPYVSGAGDTITINPLLKDKALNIIVTFLNVDGDVLYTASNIYAFTGYGQQFYNGLTRAQTSQPNIVNDQNYYTNKGVLGTELNSAVLAISEMNDQFAAQSCIDRYTFMINTTNQKLFF